MFWLWVLLGVVVLIVVGVFVDRRFALGPWHDPKERDSFDEREPKGNEQLPPGGGFGLG